ncbi:21 kDa subunit of NADH dehydrogenase [Venustampulla echinocandica]|uniref:21 kDa subunit of NADH dehydrogenase n=1 Tax=Venustampulla echinocandica TaxID=2656787 RepID=A0A370TRB9_9HELO|nr:21 kDa subunit of NADH dehydrogenase [Venustampulla echinocandica]RDL38072.1 21 kDa subunit of NADH dehydrogenase [Venustampulla echinocandica]
MSPQAAAKAVGRVIPVSKKYTLQSTGVWEVIRRFFAVDPSRSNGIPLNPEFRNPPPGSNPPHSFADPVTIPAGDIAGNPYWKRDSRRAYPVLSTVTQGDAVGLLSVGSEAAPKKELIGEAGSKELLSVKEEGQTGLASYFDKGGKQSVLGALGKDGLPPLPSGLSLKAGADKYVLTKENAYPEKYPCRTFQ